MHLKSLTLRGFKSFASATTLRFEPGITCVVGPNGSGKSNVVDALSWVMGEQGAKSLRGGKMEDVIFAGTSGRSPLGRAEVSLTIDNTDGALPIDYAEVTITRTMFRNGGSEYALNGDTCRLLDIQELLSDSGIGREMHVIVGQGRLDSVLQADPTGRRAFIEEAAGVLKHRKRKEKALRKLDAMQVNLNRVQDLVGELRRQLGPLGRQAKIARRAAGIQADLRDARLRLLADDLTGLRHAVEAEIADELALRLRRSTVEQELARAQQREAVLEAQVEQLGPRLEAARQTWYRLSALTERARGTIDLAEARARHAEASGQAEERRGRDPEELEREAERVREEEAALAEALEEARYALAEAVETRTEVERELGEEERRLKAAARAVADRREGLARLQGQAAAARSRAAGAEAEIGRLVQARDEALVRAEAADQEFRGLQEQVDELARGDEDLEEAQREAGSRLAAVDRELADARDAAGAADRERAATTARRDALALGLRRKDGSGALLAAGGEAAGVLGPAAALLKPEPGYEVAVAAALGAAADAVVVDGVEAALRALHLLRAQDAGRATLLIAGRPGLPASGEPSGEAGEQPGVLPAGARRAADLVAAPPGLRPAVRQLLATAVVVTGLDQARELVRERPELTAFTLDGDQLGAGFAQGGSAGAPSLLETQAAVDEADRAIEELTVRCALLAERLGDLTTRRAGTAAEAEQLALRARQAQKERAQVAGALGRLGGQARAAAGEAERLAASAARAEEGLEQATAAAEELAGRLATAEESADAEDQEPDAAEQARLAEAAAQARQAELETRLSVRTHEERVRALAGRADQLDRSARAEREARARAAARRERARHESAVARAVAAGTRQLLACLEISLARAAAERDEAEQARAARESELRAGREHGRELKAELDKLVDAGHRDEVLRAEKRLRIEQLEAKALDEFGIESEELLAGYGPGVPVPPGVPEEGQEPGEPRPYVRAEQEKRLRAAERAYQQLGKVNPLALEEFAALEERHQFLGEQLDDLKRSRRDLLEIVKDVDARVEQLFTAAYHDTAAQFEGVFSRLFPGGEGRLVLTDPDDMLTTGVEVEARPPGKKVKRLSLLSGGERSLTAVALLVSIFKARPSPFYVMDEVEAALDETNLRRLIAIMEELRESSQLIVITHQKLTMESADALYGVTMKGDGISQVISQRLRAVPSPGREAGRPERGAAAPRRPAPAAAGDS
ncbi:chromosome partition protein Smc [Kitasatospora herbaricolor]|uniref:chromosome segregation protein SMC n=1 Tax=Kitasatospora herbaricolor TaxID=68217 RepID=UPI001748D1E9|nr:chromosome segregation protein SMC [Kitasatospora herbaricolor]MDQ0310775.1 chromosome segregation protein [Kitasatospora herbaricolor]GGV33277.1 chromosome partition protein Smc [Kitasatospora herbaricolor]